MITLLIVLSVAVALLIALLRDHRGAVQADPLEQRADIALARAEAERAAARERMLAARSAFAQQRQSLLAELRRARGETI